MESPRSRTLGNSLVCPKARNGKSAKPLRITETRLRRHSQRPFIDDLPPTRAFCDEDRSVGFGPHFVQEPTDRLTPMNRGVLGVESEPALTPCQTPRDFAIQSFLSKIAHPSLVGQ